MVGTFSVSRGTVAKHRVNLMRKLDPRSVSGVTAQDTEWGLLSVWSTPFTPWAEHEV